MIAEFVDLLQQAGKRACRQRELPTGWQAAGPRQDDADMARPVSGLEDSPLSADLGIAYGDAAGALSTRAIVVRRVTPRGTDDFDLIAHCRLRNAVRWFIASRISTVVNLRTGEIHEGGARVMAAFRHWWADLIGTPADATRQVFRSHRHAVNLLLFLARLDGEHPEEIEIVMQYLDRVAPARLDTPLALAILDGMDPDETAFEAGLRWLRRQDARAGLLVGRSAGRIVAADGEVSDEEHDFAAQLDALLRRMRVG